MAASAAYRDDANLTEAFPMLTPTTTETGMKLNPAEPRRPDAADLSRAGTNSTSRRKPLSPFKNALLHSNPPLGMWQATGEVGSKIPTLPEIKNGAFSDAGWSHEGQMEHRGSNPHEIHRRRLARTSTSSTRTGKSSFTATATPVAVVQEEELNFFPRRGNAANKSAMIQESTTPGDDEDEIQEGEILMQTIDLDADGVAKSPATATATATVTAAGIATADDSPKALASSHVNGDISIPAGPDETGTYPNGYRFPKKHTWSQSTVIGLKAFWKFFLTPFGFVVTFYGLNVVGWGAMIFFVLLKAAPAMCHPSCDAQSSQRKIWIEIDSQVLNGLFCVTAFGLIPWRFRDLYYLMQWRIWHKYDAHRRLAGIYRGWYRLPGSDQLAEDIGPPPVYNKKHPHTPESPPAFTEEEMQQLESNPAIPLPVTSMPEPPLTGIRAPPTRWWALDFVIWMYIANTCLQVVLCGFMWGFNRHTRPGWGTGLFISLGCLTGIFAGVLVFIEGSRVKKCEGIPVQEYDVVESVDDYRERKAKEDAKQEKKELHRLQHELHKDHHELKKEHREERRILHSQKVKGHQWFTRH